MAFLNFRFSLAHRVPNESQWECEASHLLTWKRKTTNEQKSKIRHLTCKFFDRNTGNAFTTAKPSSPFVQRIQKKKTFISFHISDALSNNMEVAPQLISIKMRLKLIMARFIICIYGENVDIQNEFMVKKTYFFSVFKFSFSLSTKSNQEVVINLLRRIGFHFHLHFSLGNWQNIPLPPRASFFSINIYLKHFLIMARSVSQGPSDFLILIAV